MTSLTGSVQIFGQDVFTDSTIQQHRLGELGHTADGRKFRYVSVEPSATTVTGQTAGVTLVSGNVIQSSAQVANHLARTPVAAAIGATTITISLGATAAFVNQYAGGYAIISTGPGNGYAYEIKSHPLAASSAAALVLTLVDSVKVALTTSSRVDLQRNPYASVIQAPVTTATGAAVGVALHPIPAATTGGATGQTYGWIQTCGPAAVLIDGTPAVGAMVVATGAAAGAATIFSSTLQVIGKMMTTGVDTKNNAVFLQID